MEQEGRTWHLCIWRQRTEDMRTVLEYLEATACRWGEKTAVIDENGYCTWQELLSNSRKIGSGLLSYATPGQPVPVLMEKGIHTLSAFLGIAYAGGFYVLLNPELPQPRLEQILEVLNPACMVADAEHQEQAESLLFDRPVLLVEELEQTQIDKAALFSVCRDMVDTNPLYANFTSGSTGVPKGVVVSHRSVIDFINCFTEIFSIGEEDIIANQAPFDFDVSVKDIYSALRTGATLVIVPRQLFSRPAELLDFLCEHQVTTLTWAVSALCLVSTFHGLDYKTPDTVRRVLFSGEVMPMKHLNSWMEHLPEATFVNLYGPTEITCNCTYHIIQRDRDYTGGIPIGKAFPNEHVFLLDGENHLITAGEPEKVGELCVRGTALALGYYNAPEQTAEHFVQNPLNPCYPEQIYRTGDLARYGENGELFFAGRKDFQIKYMGHRIELEEIEGAMAAIPGMERVCCLFDEQKSRLSGYYVGTLDKKELHSRLSEKLPAYMIPTRLVQLEAMPLTKNGKIDRKALAAIKRGRRA